jgi:sigma-B regulation protein RsbU (phosphoserine phosphatase)
MDGGSEREAPRLDAETKVRLLLEIAHRTRGTLELGDVLDRLLDALAAVVAFDAAGIFVLREDVGATAGRRGALIAGVAERGFDRQRGETDPMLDLGRGIIGHVIRTGEAVVAPDVSRDPRYVVGRRATAAEATVPIVLNGRTIGALNVESDAPAAYGGADLAPLDFFAEAAAIAIERAMLHRRLLAVHEVESQLRLAQEVQARLLPPAPPKLPGYDFAGTSLPSSEIGGDYFDYLPLAGGALGLAIADVSGKGIPAALVMATFRVLLRTEVARGAGVAKTASAVNRLLKDTSGGRAFVTGFYGVLEPGRGRLAFANCGHPPPLLLRAGGGTDLLSPSGPLLGVFSDAAFSESEAILAPGDTLVLYTDGVVEALNASEEEFGAERLAAAVRTAGDRTAADVVDEVVRAARAFAGRAELTDDCTLVVVRRSGSGPRRRRRSSGRTTGESTS